VVAGQIEKECITREPTLKKYLLLVRRMDNFFQGFHYRVHGQKQKHRS
jgi:hypothetical protein